MAVDIFQMNAKKADGTLAPFYPVAHQQSVINAMAQKAVLMTNTQAITVSGYYQYSAATTNLPVGIPTTGYILASFTDSKNGQLAIIGSTLSRVLVNGVWGSWVNSANAKDTELIYPALGNGAAGHQQFRVSYQKIGRLISFSGRLRLPVVSQNQIQIASVPAAYFPQQQQFFEVPIAGKQTDLFAKIVIDVDGIIYCYLSNTSSQYFSLDGISYLTKD
ncbi:hypothetical protein [Carnobacterium maltaromaticum]|uniref:hypothetical protein n=1 Tax=Carnobacterium maltaromaticum TaxID=2751 RepID=UPI00054DEA6A|nr:hypothetical protein [Carnobacterium maltaromaticum]KRN62103.1 hypothetical protein IV70_GL000198 [Carnobacterium maltaromaticum DSM 20342]